MPTNRAITVLHLSDLQFGANHHFGLRSSPDGSTDSLLNSIIRDLNGLIANDRGLQPDIVLVTGDLAEKGRPSEFRAAADFLQDLAAHLALERKRIIVVPGNHDVNRDECAAYFQQCTASEVTPAPPFWPKWKHWVSFLHALYGDLGFSLFTPDEPWSIFEVLELQNS